MSLEHVRIKEEVVWPDEGSSGFEEVTVPMYDGLRLKIEVDLDLKAPKHEKDCDVPEASLCKSEAIDDFDNLTSQVHVKDEVESEMGVSEAAELAGLYNGCLVKEEMVIGPELLQRRESPYFFNTALTLADTDFQATSNFNRKTRDIDEPFSCEKCLIKSKHINKQTIQHKRKHMGRTFNCQTCKFINENYLDFHIRVHTGERPYVCEVCDKKFSKKYDLVEHRRGSNLHGPLPCPICNKKFWRRAYLNDHKKTHTNEILFKCDVCLKQFNKESNLITHKLTHTDVRFSCELCDKKFITNSRLISHMRQHTGKKPLSCEFCSKQFKHELLLVRHIRIRHAQDIILLSCDTCFKEFTNKDKLLEHIRKHELTCDVCSKRFKHKFKLLRHKRVHTASRYVLRHLKANPSNQS